MVHLNEVQTLDIINIIKVSSHNLKDLNISFLNGKDKEITSMMFNEYNFEFMYNLKDLYLDLNKKLGYGDNTLLDILNMYYYEVIDKETIKHIERVIERAIKDFENREGIIFEDYVINYLTKNLNYESEFIF